jgi:drug/metabolite transporter (DMT)-like permease
MNTDYAVAAAIGCSICNAVAAILQKVGSDKVAQIESYDPGVFLKLAKQLPYVGGLILDLLAGVLTLAAVSRLPIFFVQAVIASCVVLTAYMERVFLKRKLHLRTYIASFVVVIGLGVLALASHGESTAVATQSVKDSIVLLPIPLAVVGAAAVKLKGKFSSSLLAALSGIGFGFVSVVGRLLVYPHPIWLIVKDPLLWSLAAYGTLGLFFFTAALQRTLATISNGIMLSTQTLIPTLVGVIYLGDTARNGLWPLVWIGCLLVASSCVFMAVSDNIPPSL